MTPPGTFFQFKMFMLMCLLLLHCSESPDGDKQVHSKNLHLLVISEDLLRVQRLLLYGASFAKRLIVYSPVSELFASCSRDPFGSGTCVVNGKERLSSVSVTLHVYINLSVYEFCNQPITSAPSKQTMINSAFALQL